MAFGHGINKLPPSEGFVGAVRGMGFPAAEAFAWAAALSEFAGGILLALGLATRLSSLMVFGTMVVAFAGVHLRDPFAKQEMALLYLFVSLLFVLRGAGSWSIDALIRGKR
jgi:putative oxidoreductase